MNLLQLPGIAVAAISLGSIAASAAGARVEEDGYCGRFVLVGGEKEVAFVDQGATGASIGDTRAGWRVLNDEKGQPIGEVHFVATVTKVAEDIEQARDDCPVEVIKTEQDDG